MFLRVLRAFAFHLLMLLLLSWAAGTWAQTSGTMTFSASDADLDYSQTTINRIVGGQTFSVGGGIQSGGLGFDATGIYANESGNSVKLTITAPSGYLFNLVSLQAKAESPPVH